jgi:hypothetical protein
MSRDEDEITMPGTPDARRTMRTILERLEHICSALDRLERGAGETRALAKKASEDAIKAMREAAFATKRVDALVARVQAAEGRAR